MFLPLPTKLRESQIRNIKDFLIFIVCHSHYSLILKINLIIMNRSQFATSYLYPFSFSSSYA